MTGEESLRLERLALREAELLAEPLFREYGNWIAGRLVSEYGFQLSQADAERHHVAFRAELPKLTAPRGRLLLARLDDETVGVGALKPVDADTAEIKRMYVRPHARGRGIGRALLERLVDDARAEGYALLRLETMVFMTGAHALYRSLGFLDTMIFDGNEASMSGLEHLMLFMKLKL